MAQIKPFKAFLYNQEKIGNLVSVVCPPYDVIDSGARQKYAAISPYNMVRLILPTIDEAKAVSCDSIYSCAKKELDSWLAKEILCQDHQEAIYLYEQEYVYLGERKKRKGIVALLKIEDADEHAKGKSGIHAHEHTRLGPKEDRLQLLRKVLANLSPIFALFCDSHHIIKRIADKCEPTQPLIEVSPDSSRHRLWRLTDSKLINEARKDLKSADIYIADGHHRYEVACNFRKETRAALDNPDKELDCDYLMAYFTDLNSRGLTIMPTHRVIKDIPRDTLDNLSAELAKFFDMQKAKNKSDLFIMLSRAQKGACALGLYTRGFSRKNENNFFLLRLKSGINIDKAIDIDKPKEYKRLSVVILNYLILEKMLNVKEESRDISEPATKQVFYTNEADLAVKMIDDNEGQLAFFLNPVNIEQMASVAKKGERMPPKSTFFYPKLLTGLLINKFTYDI